MGRYGRNDSILLRKVICVSLLNIAKDAEWLQDKDLQLLLHCLSEEGEEARVVGGAVRDHLLGRTVNDVDIATTCLPDDVIARVKKAGFKAVPTGYEHGTITVVKEGKAYEVTTLRSDMEADGRHAKVIFGRDWKKDAERRDFTINALYADLSGNVYDEVNGLADIKTQPLRVIGVADDRIQEDYLRVLRFFRFFAWVGKGRPDAEGIKASARLKNGLLQLSGERVWSELKKTLSAPDPTRAILWMRQTGVLSVILPETEKWGIDALHPLIDTEHALGWEHDPLLRLESILPPDRARLIILADRLRLSKAEKSRLLNWAEVGTIQSDCSDMKLKKFIYYHGRQAVLDQLSLELSSARSHAISKDSALVEAGHFARLREFATTYQIPVLPVSGKDLLALGFEAGPNVGQQLKTLEKLWVDSGFRLDREALLATVKQ